MTGPVPTPPSPWSLAVLAAALMAVDPRGCGGAAIRARPGPVRDRWVERLRGYLPADIPWRRLPPQVPDSRLLGGLDLAATLSQGRPAARQGLLTDTDGGLLIVPMAERLAAGTVAHLAQALDRGEVRVERDGLGLQLSARLGVIALDEGADPDERPAPALLDRLAFWLDLEAVGLGELEEPGPDLRAVAAARERLPRVGIGAEGIEALCASAQALGIDSLRAPWLALKVARIAAALAGRERVEAPDLTLAAQLVLAPRATALPTEEDPSDSLPQDRSEPQQGPDPGEREPSPPSEADEERAADPDRPLEERVLAAVQATLPPDLLARLQAGEVRPAASASQGRAGALRQSGQRGRPVGTRPGQPGDGVRLNLVETLRAAAPWQPLRRREWQERTDAPPARSLQVRREDFRITRFQQRSATTTVFVVDASGSAALHRLAEAKGAVERLLADCYVRRDQVALLAFRGRGAELLLPPTRSLVRAKRSLAGLPGGGGTPLAAGLEAAFTLADQVTRRGDTPVVVVLTDGRANIARDGSADRTRAGEEALAAARQLRLAGVTALLVDTSPRPRPPARELAQAMGARYLPLPQADGATLSRMVQGAVG